MRENDEITGLFRSRLAGAEMTCLLYTSDAADE